MNLELIKMYYKGDPFKLEQLLRPVVCKDPADIKALVCLQAWRQEMPHEECWHTIERWLALLHTKGICQVWRKRAYQTDVVCLHVFFGASIFRPFQRLLYDLELRV